MKFFGNYSLNCDYLRERFKASNETGIYELIQLCADEFKAIDSKSNKSSVETEKPIGETKKCQSKKKS